VIAVVRSAFRALEIESTETREAWRLLDAESVVHKPVRDMYGTRLNRRQLDIGEVRGG
jgi:hypothetical protein